MKEYIANIKCLLESNGEIQTELQEACKTLEADPNHLLPHARFLERLRTDESMVIF